MTDLTMTGFAELTATEPDTYSRNRSSLYADPVAWLVDAAVRRALDSCGESLGHDGAADDVGILALSETCTARTIRSIAGMTARGRVSPLRFAGANPGSLAGLSCLTGRFRGPSVTLAMSVPAGVGPAVLVAAGWLRAGQATHVVLAVHDRRTDGDGQVHHARCAVTRLGRDGEPDMAGDLTRVLLGTTR
ncbi:hypothetical protein [Actinophytocola oryzae]|uniref:Beta-ketoacyl synthase-like protein n=1 Tax=Actinophytocola oryzae TaxID=502181 RepID=A0A4R7URV8_9PSEU|nr:hypothetical protein [Actinophytocola oryzae]TDV37788.1 hypothetical protein CLV71_12852 [Actinophytocola oryzae]